MDSPSPFRSVQRTHGHQDEAYFWDAFHSSLNFAIRDSTALVVACQEALAILRFWDSSLNKLLWSFVAPCLWIFAAYNSQCSQFGAQSECWIHAAFLLPEKNLCHGTKTSCKCQGEASFKVWRSSWRCYQGFFGRKERVCGLGPERNAVGLDCFEGRLMGIKGRHFLEPW